MYLHAKFVQIKDLYLCIITQKYVQHLSENSDSAFQTNWDQSEGTWILMIGVRSEASRKPKPLLE